MDERTNVLDAPKTSRKTHKTTDAIRERYALGVEANATTKTADGQSKYGFASVPTFARGDGSSDSFIYDSQQFASAYSPEQVEEVIELCEGYDSPFGPSHLFELMRIRHEGMRSRIQVKAICHFWSVNKLKAEIRKLKRKS